MMQYTKKIIQACIHKKEKKKHLCYYENDVLLICYILNARVVNLFHN